MTAAIQNGLAGISGAQLLPGSVPVLDFGKASGDPNAGAAVGDSGAGDDGSDDSTVDDGKPITFKSQAELDKVIQERVGREKKKATALQETNDKLSARVQELEPLEVATQTDTQRWEKEKKQLVERNAELEAYYSNNERANLVREIATAKGLPDGFLNRVSGDTPEDIEADVDSLLETLNGSVKATKPAATTKPREDKTKSTKASHGGGDSDDDSLPPISDLAMAMRKGAGQPYISKN